MNIQYLNKLLAKKREPTQAQAHVLASLQRASHSQGFDNPTVTPLLCQRSLTNQCNALSDGPLLIMCSVIYAPKVIV